MAIIWLLAAERKNLQSSDKEYGIPNKNKYYSLSTRLCETVSCVILIRAQFFATENSTNTLAYYARHHTDTA